MLPGFKNESGNSDSTQIVIYTTINNVTETTDNVGRKLMRPIIIIIHFLYRNKRNGGSRSGVAIQKIPFCKITFRILLQNIYDLEHFLLLLCCSLFFGNIFFCPGSVQVFINKPFVLV